MIAQTWLAHRVRRYHSNAALAHLGQTNADHAHGVTSIILALHPAPSKNLMRAALWHDVGEASCGDLPSPFKKAYPQVAYMHARAEKFEAGKIAGAHADLEPAEGEWLKMADGLEAVLFTAFYRPGLLDRQDWVEHVQDVLERADRLGVEGKVEEAIKAVASEGMQ